MRLTPFQNISKHVKIIDKCANRVLTNNTIHLLRQIKLFIKYICANQLKLILDAFLRQFLLRHCNHTFRNVEAVDFICTLGSQFLAAWAKTASDLEECLTLDTFLHHFLEASVVALLLHKQWRLAPNSIDVRRLIVLISIFVPSLCSWVTNSIFTVRLHVHLK